MLKEIVYLQERILHRKKKQGAEEIFNTDKQSKEEGKSQESIQSSTTPDPGQHMGKWQKHKKTSRTRELIG